MTFYRRYAEQVTNSIPVVYKNFVDKLQKKKFSHIQTYNIISQDLAIFLKLSILKDTDTIETIKLLKNHFENYENIYYNRKLYKILKKYKKEVFAIRRPDKRKRKAFRTSVGLKLRKITLFKL
jgi:hypothetical protein